MPKSDWTTDPTAKRWIEHVLEDMVPKMKESAMVMSLVPKGMPDHGDIKFWVELGGAICYDKPILTVAFSDDDVPPKLRMISDEIVILEEGLDPASSEEIADALVRMKERLDDGSTS